MRSKLYTSIKEAMMASYKGGPGSGDYGHAGRPGEQGGSASGKGGALSYEPDGGKVVGTGDPTYRIKGHIIDPTTGKKKTINQGGMTMGRVQQYLKYADSGPEALDPQKVADAKNRENDRRSVESLEVDSKGALRRIYSKSGEVIGKLQGIHDGIKISQWVVYRGGKEVGRTKTIDEAKLLFVKSAGSVESTKGGPGSGFYAHSGRPGKVGGSSAAGTSHAFAGQKANPAGPDTDTQYKNPDGTWTKERKKLHDRIIARYFKGKTPVENPTSYILGGGGAAGKTTLVKSGLLNIPKNTVLAAGDDIKLMLPEYQKWAGDEGSGTAAYVHEESSELAKEIAAKAAAGGYNVLMDGTGDNSMESLKKKIDSMTSKGQKITGIYVTVDMATAVARNEARYQRTGRRVPTAVFKATHAAVSRLFPDIAKSNLYDHLYLYDTSSGSDKLIASGGKGIDFTIHDPDAYQKFLDKANQG